MSDLAARLALKRRLPRAWPAFFERHGAFTATQEAAIPPILDGHNVIVCAPTASGKTTAVVAPLIERYCPPARAGDPPPAGPRLLYLTPTRALVNDLAARLAPALEVLSLGLAVKTRDTNTLRPTRPAALLLTTPESLDSLLTTQARLLAQVRAVVIDEIHLFDGTARGDQLRVLLNRVRRVRAHAAARGDATDADLQFVALSATLADPAATAARYFAAAQVILVPGGRPLEAESLPLAADDAVALLDYLATFGRRGWRKALVFCNSRAEVEAYAAAARARSPFGGAVFVHYSNIEARRRREIEQQFAAAGAAICFASSTLELGIDIGDIDVVLLIGPPGNASAFLQRIGRGNRRRRTTRVACFARDPLERLLFQTLLAAPEDLAAGSGAPFRPSVAVQQVFSLLKQSPTGGLRLAEFAELCAGMLMADDLLTILGRLRRLDYLRDGRPGEWRAGDRLNELIDLQARPHSQVSIHANIDVTEPAVVAVRDQHTGQIMAHVEPLWLAQPVLTLEGRAVTVEWHDGEVLWVSAGSDPAAGRPLFASARQLLSYAVARRLPEHLGLAPATAPVVATPRGWCWFHWLGDLYGRAMLDLLRYRVAAGAAEHIGLALYLPDEPAAPPVWSEGQVVRYLQDHYRDYEALLALGPFHHLLPPELRQRAVVEQFDVPAFLAAVAALRPVAAPEALADDLTTLLGEQEA